MNEVIKHIDFIEMFCGIGGFRFGLEKANHKDSLRETSAGQGLRSKRDSSLSIKGIEGQHTSFDEDSGEISKANIEFSRRQRQAFYNYQRRGGNNSSKSDVRQTAFRCVWSNDWLYGDYKWKPNKDTGELEWKGQKNHSGKIYRKHWNDGTYLDADIRSINTDSIPDHTLLTAGFPCQSFSLAGKRKGFKDTRGTLFYEICRVAKAKRPKILLLENVRGLLSHDKGLTFQIILESLDDLGYFSEWQCLNSKYFGVPQTRQRVFIIGHLRGHCSREIFPIIEIEETLRPNRPSRPLESSSKSLLQINNLYENKADAGRIYSAKGVARTLKGKAGGLGGKTGLYEVRQYGKMKSQKPQRWDEVAHTVRRDLGRNVKKPHNPVLLPNMRVRRLTPVDCERLQGFPDDWSKFGFEEGKTLTHLPKYDWVFEATEPDGDMEWIYRQVGKYCLDYPLKNTVLMSDTQRYNGLGNAVTTNVIEFLGRRILELDLI